MVWPTKNRKMKASANAVRHALSVRRAEFTHHIDLILGEANRQGGGVADLASGVFVGRFVREVNAELRNRAQIASEALSDALTSQKLTLHQSTVRKVIECVQPVWEEETQDVRAFYELRVQRANEEIAREHPFESAETEAFQGIFVGLENEALAPGLLAKIWDRIVEGFIDQLALLIVGIIMMTLAYIYREWVLSLLSRLLTALPIQ